MAKSFKVPSENAEGRLSAVIGRRQFALGRGPEGWEPTPGAWRAGERAGGARARACKLAVAVSTFNFLLLCWPTLNAAL